MADILEAKPWIAGAIGLALATLFPLWTSVVVRNYAFTILLQRRGILNTGLVSAGGAVVVSDPALTSASDHRVLAAKMVQDRGIYLYVDDPVRKGRCVGRNVDAFGSLVALWIRCEIGQDTFPFIRGGRAHAGR